MNLDEIESLIRTETGCRQLLREIRFPDGKFVCHCKNEKAYNLATRKKVSQCTKCKTQSSLTSGTFFHGKKLPLTKCFALLIAILTAGEKSQAQIARDVCVSPATVWRWSQEVRLKLNGLFIDENTVVVDRELLAKVLFRRCVETPAINHKPDTEQSSEAPIEPCSDEEGFAVLKTMRFISTAHHGVSTKYSQLYAAGYRALLRSQSIMSLLVQVIRAGPVSVQDVADYSSPKLIVLPA